MPAESGEDVPKCPHWYRVCLNTIVRNGVKLDSERMRILPMGSRVHVIQVQERRVQIDQPISGWCSLRSSNGDTILSPLDNSTNSIETPRSVGSIKTATKNLKKNVRQTRKELQNLEHQREQALENPRVNKLNLEIENLKKQLAKMGQTQVERDALKTQLATQEAENQVVQSKLSQLQSLQTQLEEVAESEGVADPDALAEQIQTLQSSEENFKQQLSEYKGIADAAESELKQMRMKFTNMFMLQEEDPTAVTGQASSSTPTYERGDVVMVRKLGLAFVKFFGQVAGQDGLFVGVEFETAVGDSDGIVDGVEYFRVAEDCGMFLPLAAGDILQVITPEQLLIQLSKNIQKLTILNNSLRNE